MAYAVGEPPKGFGVLVSDDDDTVRVHDWDGPGQHKGVAYAVGDPTGEYPSGFGIIVLDDDTVRVHDGHGTRQIGGESKAIEILDDLDRRHRKERKQRSSMGKQRRRF